MNTIVNDKLLSFSTTSNRPNETNSTRISREEEQASQSIDPKPGNDDSLELSAAGKQLNQSAARESDSMHALPSTAQQASALAAKIREQFEQMGSQALNTHSLIQRTQIDQLLRPNST